MFKNYEKINKNIIISICILIIEGLLFFLFMNMKLITYNKYPCIIFSNKLMYLMVNNNELKDIYQNKTFYIDNEKKKLEIDHINKNVLKRNGKSINQVFINYKSSNRDNEVIEIVLQDEKISIIKMFSIMWKEDV